MFLAHLEQDDPGCGYRIECAHKIMKLQSQNIDDAKTELEGIITGDWDDPKGKYVNGYHGGRKLRSATIYEYSAETPFDVGELYVGVLTAESQVAAHRKGLEEQAEFERLKAIYEPQG